jgi:hypothetical protein
VQLDGLAGRSHGREASLCALVSTDAVTMDKMVYIGPVAA